MADLGIGEILLTLFGVEQVGTLLYQAFEAITSFLGYDGSMALLDVVGKGIGFGDYLLNDVILDVNGVVTGLVNNNIPHAAELLDFLKKLSQQMVNEGISRVTKEGKDFVKSVFNKLNDYSTYINVAGTASYITQKIEDFKSKYGNPNYDKANLIRPDVGVGANNN